MVKEGLIRFFLSEHWALCASAIFLLRPTMTIFSASSGRGRCSAFASSHGACIQVPYFSTTGTGRSR
jgi:hypothetical protein